MRVVPRRTVVGVNVTNNSPSRDYSHPDDQTTQTKPWNHLHLVKNAINFDLSKQNGPAIIRYSAYFVSMENRIFYTKVSVIKDI